MKSGFGLLNLPIVLIRLIFILLVFSFFTKLNAQTPVYRSIGETEGLPSLTIYRLLQDAQDYIWIASQDGLYRYDGKNFKLYKHPQQKDNEILKLQEDKYGRIWFSNLSKQVFYCENGQVHLFYEQAVEETSFYFNFEIGYSAIYLVYTFGENYPDNTKIEEINLETLDIHNNKQTVHYTRILPDLFKASKDEVFYFIPQKKGDKVICKSLNSPKEYESLVFKKKDRLRHGMLVLEKGKMLIYSRLGERYYIVEKGEEQQEFFIDKKIRNVKLIDGQLFFLTNEGFIVLGEKSEALLPNYQINDLLKDREGNYWLATNGDGLLMIPSLDFNLIEATADDIVYSLVYNKATELVYAGHGAQQISIFDKHTQKLISKEPIDARGGRIVDIVFHPALGLILASDKGMYAENTALNSLVQAQGAHSATGAIKKIMLSTDNKLWIGTYGVVLYVDLNKIDQTYKEEEILFKRTYGLCEDRQGTIWIGTTSGLYTYKNGNIELFPLAEKIGQEPIVSDIALTSDNSIWVTSNNVGVLQIKNEQLITHYNTSSNTALQTNDFRSVFVDQNELWFASNKGLYQLDVKQNQWQLINTCDGLPSDDVLKVLVQEQTVWVSTIKGLLTFPKRAVKKNDLAPPVYIVGLDINNRDTVLQKKTYELPYDQNSIYINFEGLAYRNRGKLNYEYRLLGLQENWNISDNRFVRYHALEPGNYTFEVRAINEDAVKSEAPARLSLCIAPPWWKRMWFRGVVLLFLGALAYLLVNRRIQRLKEQQAYQSKINEVRMLALQSQMNPHFIFNALNAIQFFLGSKNEEQAMIYLARFAQLIRLSFEYSKEKLITLEDEIAFLKLYLSLESLRFNNTIEVEWSISNEVQRNVYAYKVPPLLIQPVIENAFKHGLFHKKENKKLWIRLEQKAGFLSCSIEDNGVGRQKVAQINEWKTKKHRSLGLKTTQERLLLLNEAAVNQEQQRSYLTIEDLVDAKGQALGTRVELLFKLQT